MPKDFLQNFQNKIKYHGSRFINFIHDGMRNKLGGHLLDKTALSFKKNQEK